MSRYFSLPLAIIAAMGAMLLAMVALGPVPAFASGPSSTAQATVTVQQTISFAFTSSTSFSLSPGVTDNNAISFNVSTNDTHGYNITLAGTDLATSGGATIPAADLTYTTFSGGAEVDQGPAALSNTTTQFYSSTQATGGTPFSQNWTANIAANTAPGAYTSTLTYVANGL